MRGTRPDFAAYARAFPLLFSHLSIVVAPLLAAIVAILLTQLGQFLTDPIGGIGIGIYAFLGQLVYLMAFGVAIIQARNIWRGSDGSFDAAWVEAKAKLGSLAIAAVGFSFLIAVAGQLGAFFGAGAISLVLQLAVAFFLIYTIPAAAAGNAPGTWALTVSYRAAAANPAPTALLAIAFVFFIYVVPLLLAPLYAGLPDIAVQLVRGAIEALLFAYLAFPFARTYDEVA